MLTSAGLLLFDEGPRVFLAHMGGPYWAGKDARAWSIPKGLYDLATEDPLAAARREFAEEIGVEAPEGPALDLGTFRQNSGKQVRVFAVRAEDPVTFRASNTFHMEWPRGSGRIQEFPEMDRAEWFDLATARVKLVRGQVPALDALVQALAG